MTGKGGGSDASSGRPGAPRRGTHGRRRGRPLRRGLKTLLETLLPRLQVVLPPSGGPLDPAELLGGGPDQLWLEIGFGAGEHLALQAARHPEVAMLGAEVFVNGIAGLLRRIDTLRLTNVRVFQGDGRDLLDALPESSLSRVFILFPDPWPKRRHHKRRIVQAALLDRLAHVMKDGAELRMATDHRDYLCWMLEVATAHPAFRWLARGPRDWRERPADWPVSRYEVKALGEGLSPTYLRFVRRRRTAA
jgi:tRNA (guanine-N7-)-methyltransferase